MYNKWYKEVKEVGMLGYLKERWEKVYGGGWQGLD